MHGRGGIIVRVAAGIAHSVVGVHIHFHVRNAVLIPVSPKGLKQHPDFLDRFLRHLRSGHNADHAVRLTPLPQFSYEIRRDQNHQRGGQNIPLVIVPDVFQFLFHSGSPVRNSRENTGAKMTFAVMTPMATQPASNMYAARP